MRHQPEAGFTGADNFIWSVNYPTPRGDVTTKTVTCGLVVKAPGMTDWPQWRADEWRSGFTTMKLPAALQLTIRPAAGQGHRGTIKDAKGNYTGFALKGTLDAGGLPYARVCGVIVDSSGALSVGPGASLSRVLAGEVRLGGNSMAANVVGASLGATNAAGFSKYEAHFYYLVESSRPRPSCSRVSFYNCTATTFDPADQAEVEFINCLAAPGGKGFHDDPYADGAYLNHCVSADGTAVRWDSGDGNEGNVANQAVQLANAAAGDDHLQAADKTARGRGAPGLGMDMDGEERTGPAYDVGADAVGVPGRGQYNVPKN